MIINSLFSKSSLKDKLKRDVTLTHYLHSIGTKCSHIVKCYYSLLAIIIQFYKSLSYFISTKQLYVICFFIPFISYYNTSFSKFVISIITCLPSSFLFFAFIGMCILFIIYVHTLSLRSQITPFKFEFFKVIIIKIRLFPLSIRISLLLIVISLSVYFVGNIFFFLSTLLLSLEVLFEFYIPFYFRVVISLIFLINFFKVCFIDLIACKLTLYSMGFILCLSLLIIIFTHKSLVIRLLASFLSTLIRFFIIGSVERSIIHGTSKFVIGGGGIVTVEKAVDLHELYKEYDQEIAKGHGSFFKGVPKHGSVLVTTSELSVKTNASEFFSQYYAPFMHKVYTTYEPLTIEEEVEVLGTPGNVALSVTDFGALSVALGISSLDLNYNPDISHKKDAFYGNIMETLKKLPNVTLGDVAGADHLSRGNYNQEYIAVKTYMETRHPGQKYTLRRGIGREPDFVATFDNGDKLFLEIGRPSARLDNPEGFADYIDAKKRQTRNYEPTAIVLGDITKTWKYNALLDNVEDRIQKNIATLSQRDFQDVLDKHKIRAQLSAVSTSKYGYFDFRSVHEPPSYVVPYKKAFPIIRKFK